MLAVVRCYKHLNPVIVEVFEKYDEQTQKDALELATILSRRDNCEYRVMVEYWLRLGIQQSKL